MNEIDELIAHLHNWEWLSKLLLRNRSKPLKVAFGMIMVNLVANISIAAFTKTLKTSPNGIGLLNDYTTWAFILLFQPALLGSYCWLQTSSQQLLGHLIHNGVLNSNLNSIFSSPFTK